MITREDLRGKPLLKECNKARQVNYLYGIDDKRILCYGLLDSTGKNIASMCLNCKAYAYNAKPPKEKQNTY